MTRVARWLPWLALFVAFSPRARALVIPRAGRTPPAGVTPVMLVNTGGGDWKGDRLAALAVLGFDGDVARAIVAHWAFETGFGKGEWNWNVGNRIALPGERGVDIGVQWNKAYPSLAEGIADYIALLQMPRYAIAWHSLQNAPRSTVWTRQLAAAGYATTEPTEYERRYAGFLTQMG